MINMAIGTGAGAVVGGLLGGRRGAGWGRGQSRSIGTLHIQDQAETQILIRPRPPLTYLAAAFTPFRLRTGRDLSFDPMHTISLLQYPI